MFRSFQQKIFVIFLFFTGIFANFQLNLNLETNRESYRESYRESNLESNPESNRESNRKYDLESNRGKKFEPNWESLDSRPLPLWYDEAKFGIFMHWGVYSVPGFINEWFVEFLMNPDEGDIHTEVVEFMQKHYRPNFTYVEFASEFRTEFFDPFKFVEIIKNAGAR